MDNIMDEDPIIEPMQFQGKVIMGIGMFIVLGLITMSIAQPLLNMENHRFYARQRRKKR